ncbi:MULTISPECIES: hypothetical protein [unclassified Phenylobacterium]|jgi:hypothetical protein|uniref:hypothetical protein n=1 Tax=unclassified Phenylobacterium TaxID=2640670 RepID=UPI0012E39C04|nr:MULTISPECIES: hypothetical protein [unclassified Phenylobacterium]
MSDYYDDVLDEEPTGTVVRWMDRPPLHLGPAALSGAVAGAFLLGAVAALGLVVLSRRTTFEPRLRSRFSRLLH